MKPKTLILLCFVTLFTDTLIRAAESEDSTPETPNTSQVLPTIPINNTNNESIHETNATALSTEKYLESSTNSRTYIALSPKRRQKSAGSPRAANGPLNILETTKSESARNITAIPEAKSKSSKEEKQESKNKTNDKEPNTLKYQSKSYTMIVMPSEKPGYKRYKFVDSSTIDLQSNKEEISPQQQSSSPNL